MNLQDLTTFEEINPALFQLQTYLSSPPDFRPENGTDVSCCSAYLSSRRWKDTDSNCSVIYTLFIAKTISCLEKYNSFMQ